MNGDMLRICREAGLTKEGLAFVQRTAEMPARLVRAGHGGNVAGRFSSMKMRMVIQSESSTCELPFVHQAELDPEVKGYFDQPQPLHYYQFDKLGRRSPAKHVADYLFIKTLGIELWECKLGDNLTRLHQERPDIWLYENGVYRVPLREKAARALGMTYHIHNADSIGVIEQANLRTMVNIVRNPGPALDKHELSKARHAIGDSSLTIHELAECLHMVDITPILRSIVAKDLFVPIHFQLLVDHTTTCVYADLTIAAAAEELLRYAAIDRAQMQSGPMLKDFSGKALLRGREIIRRLIRIEAGELKATRSDYRAIKSVKAARAEGQLPLIAVIPKYHMRGGGSALPPEVIAATNTAIRERYLKDSHPSLKLTHNQLLLELKKQGQSISYESMRRRCKSLPKREVALARQGIRSAFAEQSPVLPMDRSIRTGLSWERTHLDSTPIDDQLWLTFSASRFLARPTMFSLIDEAHQFGLAYWLCFERRGKDALSCVLRDCLRRHGQLPHQITVDQGSEFHSAFYQGVTAIHVIDHEMRPASASRWGGVGEASHIRNQKMILHQMPGNTTNDKIGRAGNKETRSAAHAKLDLLTFLQIVEEGWGILNRRPVNIELPSPLELFEEDNRTFAGLNRRIELTPDVLAATAVDAGTRVIRYGKGIRFERRDYTGKDLHDSKLDGRVVEIKYEPYDPTTIYASVNGSWCALHSSGYSRVQHMGHLARCAELYYAFDTGAAQRIKKMAIDAEAASMLREKILQADVTTQVAAAGIGTAKSRPDPFAQMREIPDDDLD